MSREEEKAKQRQKGKWVWFGLCEIRTIGSPACDTERGINRGVRDGVAPGRHRVVVLKHQRLW